MSGDVLLILCNGLNGRNARPMREDGRKRGGMTCKYSIQLSRALSCSSVHCSSKWPVWNCGTLRAAEMLMGFPIFKHHIAIVVNYPLYSSHSVLKQRAHVHVLVKFERKEQATAGRICTVELESC